MIEERLEDVYSFWKNKEIKTWGRENLRGTGMNFTKFLISPTFVLFMTPPHRAITNLNPDQLRFKSSNNKIFSTRLCVKPTLNPPNFWLSEAHRIGLKTPRVAVRSNSDPLQPLTMQTYFPIKFVPNEVFRNKTNRKSNLESSSLSSLSDSDDLDDVL